MRPLLILVAFSTALSLAACGGAPATPATPTSPADPAAHHEGEKGEAREHESSLPGPVRDFHQVLAPVWHAEKGADRVAKTCAQATPLHDKAVAIVSAPAPEKTDATAWKAEAQELVAATTSLAAECAKEGKPEFDARFTSVHTHFHKLTEGLKH